MASNVNYEDATPIPDATVPTAANVDQLATLVARWLRTKMYGADVRESLARWVEITTAVMKLYDDDIETHKNTVSKQVADVTARQTDVEGRMTSQETTYRDLIKELTDQDTGDAAAEIIAARTDYAGKQYDTLADRLNDAQMTGLVAMPVKQIVEPSTLRLTDLAAAGDDNEAEIQYAVQSTVINDTYNRDNLGLVLSNTSNFQLTKVSEIND